MARIRSLKPEFYDDELLGHLPLPVRYLYQGLWVFADDKGRFRGAPAWVRSKVFPFDEDITVEQVSNWLDCLKDNGRIELYSEQGQKYGWVCRFLKHQYINRPQESLLPAPTSHDYPSETDSRNAHGTLTEDSDTNHCGKGEEGKGNGREGKGRERVVAREPQETFNDVSEDSLSLSEEPDRGLFLKVWGRWPQGRRGAQRRARSAWHAAAERLGDEDAITKSAEQWIAYWQHDDNGTFAYNITKWLNDDLWKESPPEQRKANGTKRDHELLNTLNTFIERGSDHES